MRKLSSTGFLAALLFLSTFSARAHLGNTAVFYEGNAGPYQIRVSIQAPEVVPGLAQINVRVHNGPVTKVSALPVRWDAGRKGAPAPDIAKLVKGETNLYNTELWLMTFGSYSVFVDVEGPRGKGTAIVPLNSISVQRRPMPKWMGAAFLTAGLSLVLLLVCIVGAAVRESVVPAGEVLEQRKIWRSWLFMGLATVLITGGLWKGKRWWDEVDADFRNNRLFKPVKIDARIENQSDKASLLLSIDHHSRNWKDHTPLVADHGKLMHLFLVQEHSMNAFAHLHPLSTSESTFETVLPQLPPGDYSIYADVVHESGLTQTLISKLNVPESNHSTSPLDADDSSWIGSVADGDELALPNGLKIRALKPMKVLPRKEVTLSFDVLAADGKPALLEPYMGMWSHAVIRSADGTVFTHLHPAGTISMTAQELFARRERGESPTAKPIDAICGRPERELHFPYSFPKAGQYRIWVQVKCNGQIMTGAFNILVETPT